MQTPMPEAGQSEERVFCIVASVVTFALGWAGQRSDGSQKTMAAYFNIDDSLT